MRRAIVTTLAVVALTASTVASVGAASTTKMVGINVLLDRPVSNAILADLATYGKVRDVLRELQGGHGPGAPVLAQGHPAPRAVRRRLLTRMPSVSASRSRAHRSTTTAPG